MGEFKDITALKLHGKYPSIRSWKYASIWNI